MKRSRLKKRFLHVVSPKGFRGRMRTMKYHGYNISMKQIGKNEFDWEVRGISVFTGARGQYFGGGLAVVANEKEAMKIAKAYVDEQLQRM